MHSKSHSNTANAGRYVLFPIADIHVGERRRVDVGDISDLAQSIQRYGLLHPIVVDDGCHLVAGERRLRAYQQLGWTAIPCRHLGELTEAERRELELEENLRRKDLTDYERSRNLSQLAETAKEVLIEEGQQFCADSAQNPKGGRPRKPASTRAVAERVGIPDTTIREAQEHVEIADTYPFMQSWKQSQVLAAHEALEKLPESDRAPAAELINQPGVPAKDAIEILDNLVNFKPPERQYIFEQAESDDGHKRSNALAAAARKPPMPDPAVAMLTEARRLIGNALKAHPDDASTPVIQSAIKCVDAAKTAVKEISSNGEH